ncbi:hypothetical protein [Streptomyces kanamyceticus]|uniref:hypothetical protein n=1 Tax=Streptomyces kanamyceticus TaxID=1967 RepID=UPI00123E380F|nr:hypothetical protein [Streptomyces kanamyceticus]
MFTRTRAVILVDRGFTKGRISTGGTLMRRLTTRAIAVTTGLLIMGSSATAFASDSPVAPPMTADGAAVEPGTVTGSPASGADVATGADADATLEEDQPIPGETDGPDLGEGDKGPASEDCPQGPFVHITRNLKNTTSVKYSTFAKNNKGYSLDFKFTSKRSGTTTYGASLTLSSDFKVRWLGEIKAELQGSAEKSWTSELGVETGGKVKAHSTVYGDYGIRKEKVYGYYGTRYRNCSVGHKQYVTFWAPYREGWTIR